MPTVALNKNILSQIKKHKHAFYTHSCTVHFFAKFRNGKLLAVEDIAYHIKFIKSNSIHSGIKPIILF